MVNKFGLIFLLILLGLLSCESQELEKPLVSDDDSQNFTSGSLSQTQFTHFMLVQTWPPTYCKSHRCAQNPGRFTIHGLWPQQTGSPGRNQLTDATLDPRRPALLEYWPDLKTKNFQTSKNFWRSEYRKHGVYCTKKYSADEYFTKALLYGGSFKTHVWLAKNNIVPHASKKYARSDIVAAIRSYTSTTPDLQCFTDGGKSYLLEIRLCLDDKLEKLINCGGRVGQCGTQVQYPPAPTGSQTSEEILEITEEDLFEVV